MSSGRGWMDLACLRRGLQGLLLLVSLLAPAGAATATWTNGAGSSTWSEAANWTPAPPTAGDAIALPANAHVQRDTNDTTPYESVTCAGDATVSGLPLVLVHAWHQVAGRGVIRCPLVGHGGLELTADASATIEATGAIDLAASRLALAGSGQITVSGCVLGTGGIDGHGPGRYDLSGPSAFTGSCVVAGGECWVHGAVDPGHAGACGAGTGPVVVDGGCLVLVTSHWSSPVLIGEHGGRIDAAESPREMSGGIQIMGLGRGGLTGSYVATSLRGVLADDWRQRPDISGTRLDPTISFPASNFGTPEEQARWHIQGSATDWDNFSVQWDGFLRVEHPGTRLYTCSDDGSRVWLDLNHDGRVQDSEWGSNGWGTGHGAVVQQVHGPLAAGIYPIRIQFEDGGGPDCMVLLWDDPEHADGTFAGHSVVPTTDLLLAAHFMLGGDEYGENRGQVLTISGPVRGAGVLTKVGSSRLILTGGMENPDQIAVEGGTLLITQPLTPPAGSSDVELRINQHARLELQGGAHVRALAGSGCLALIHGDLILTCANACQFAGDIEGPGTLRKRGRGTATLPGRISAPTCAEDGLLFLGDGRILAGVHLCGPLNAELEFPVGVTGARRIEASITVPTDAPGDLGWGVNVGDLHGHWCQQHPATPLHAGTQQVSLDLGADQMLRSEPQGMGWQSLAPTATRTVLCVWSASPSRAVVPICLQSVPSPPVSTAPPHLVDFSPTVRTTTGRRAEWSFHPVPFPVNPYDRDDFSVDGELTQPDGSIVHLAGFFWQDMAAHDRGDRELVMPTGDESFKVRARPRSPGTYHLRLQCRWHDGTVLRCEAPPLVVSGPPWDGYVHVDADDARFFSRQGAFVWPIGLNVRSVADTRSQSQMGTKLTPDRGFLAYRAYLQRLAAAGGDAVEIWLSPWNLGLEWRQDWNGFYGVGRYNQANAWRIDRILDTAEELGLHINLVILNHGQASEGADHEWENSPYNTVQGGRLHYAAEYFTNPWALTGQEAYRRYLVARYADSPAILGWKLWSEVNLTNAGEAVVAWHAHASERWSALDAYHHPITTHWAGDWHAVDGRVGALPGLDYLCIDAYQSGRLLADLLTEGVAPGALGRFHKPVLVTESGGSWNGCPVAEMVAEQASGPWASLVSGNAGSAMLWWYEFVDQRDLWATYGALHRFIAGEDLRGADAQSRDLSATSPSGGLWCRAWCKPARMLGYLLDRSWGTQGMGPGSHAHAQIACGEIGAGDLVIEWWDADTGQMLLSQSMTHPGGQLTLLCPAFTHHLGFKIIRSHP